MPSVPMLMPSEPVGKPQVCGMPPAALTASTARSTSEPMPALHGFMVEWPCAIPTIGLAKSAAVKPTG